MSTESIDGQVYYNDRATTRGFNAGFAVAIFGVVLMVVGFGSQIYFNNMETARQEGRQQVVSAIGGLYASCTQVQPVPLREKDKPVPADVCQPIYDTYITVSDAYGITKKR
jgi:hypothetical protein